MCGCSYFTSLIANPKVRAGYLLLCSTGTGVSMLLFFFERLQGLSLQMTFKLCGWSTGKRKQGTFAIQHYNLTSIYRSNLICLQQKVFSHHAKFGSAPPIFKHGYKFASQFKLCIDIEKEKDKIIANKVTAEILKYGITAKEVNEIDPGEFLK